MKKLVMTMALLVAATACAPSNDSSPKDTPDTPPEKLVVSDLVNLQNTDSSALAKFDRVHNGMFTKVFGGPSGTALMNYMDARIHYTMTIGQANEALKDFKGHYTDWGKSASTLDANSEATVGAMNLGTALWLQSIIDREPVNVPINNQIVPVNSSRVGIMVFGPGYSDHEKVDGKNLRRNGTEILTPPEYRNIFLLHEARHSDCTGGTSQKDLDVLRNSKNIVQSLREYKRLACGHLHSICPYDNKTFGGMAACDNHAWGAYTVGIVYAQAIEDSTNDSVVRVFMDAAISDMGSRVNPTLTEQLYGNFGQPDMSNIDKVDP